jgi:hypothetical protein
MRSKVFETGGYIYIDSPNAKGWHQCEPEEFFANQRPYDTELNKDLLKWTGTKVGKDLLLQVAALANCFPRMEIMVCLYYSSTEQKWLANVPKQKGSGAHVKYDDEDFDPPKGYEFLGTIHTHPEMSAFWSCVDRNDQNRKNGLHLVLGLRNGKINEVLCSLFYNGKQYDQPDAYELPAADDPLPEVNEDWKAKVTMQELQEPKLNIVKDTTALLEPDWYPSYSSADFMYDSDSISPCLSDTASYFDVLNSAIKLDEPQLYELCAQLLEILGQNDLAAVVDTAAAEAFADTVDACCEARYDQEST